jgi:hypothetical protein
MVAVPAAPPSASDFSRLEGGWSMLFVSRLHGGIQGPLLVTGAAAVAAPPEAQTASKWAHLLSEEN